MVLQPINKFFQYLVADLLDSNLNLFFSDTEPPIINILYGWSGICGQFGLCSFIFSFTTASKLIVFLCCYTWSLLFHLLDIWLFHMHVSIKSFDCILLSSFEFKAILLISSVKVLRFSLLNLCCIFNIDLLFFYKLFMIFFNAIYVSFIFFWEIYFILKLSCF